MISKNDTWRNPLGMGAVLGSDGGSREGAECPLLGLVSSTGLKLFSHYAVPPRGRLGHCGPRQDPSVRPQLLTPP